MARYTDIDKLIAEYDRVHVGPAGGARKLMVDAPIADVVPRADVEYWKEQCLFACMNNGYIDDKVIAEYLRKHGGEGHNDPVGAQGECGLESAVRYAKAEVARKIFEEIENTWQDSESCAKFDKALAELKKKYTERCTDRKHFVGCECFSGMTCDEFDNKDA